MQNYNIDFELKKVNNAYYLSNDDYENITGHRWYTDLVDVRELYKEITLEHQKLIQVKLFEQIKKYRGLK